MGNQTAIQWTDATFNPWIGCARKHIGCLHCYAEREMDGRFHRVKWGLSGTRQLTSPQAWRAVRSLDAMSREDGIARTVFCASFADVFEPWRGQMIGPNRLPLWIASGIHGSMFRPDVTTEEPPEGRKIPCGLGHALRGVLAAASEYQNLRFLMLTKRPDGIGDRIAEASGLERLPGNCIAGTSISDQETAEKYAGKLRAAKDRGLVSAVFLSYEPAVGPVRWDSLRLGEWCDWVIVGGESSAALQYPRNPQSRPCRQLWIEQTVAACDAARIPVFVKQFGEVSIDDRGRRQVFRDKKGGNPDEWPEAFRIRQRLVNPDGSLLRLSR